MHVSARMQQQSLPERVQHQLQHLYVTGEWHGLPEGLEAPAIVLLYHRSELVNTPLIDQVLEP